ncbi:MAG TPA: ABC transporter substrate-binding protein [Xanthobacteraceae bacterium]|nr:ABC transporter substrate-binding protein [Xanthobacteraceae bacterium]
MKISRRDTLLGAIGFGGSLLAMPAILRAAEGPAIRCATATPGFTVVFYDLIRDMKLDQKYGFTLEAPTLNSSIGTLFNDFVAGSSDLIISSWDPILTRFHGGVPCQLLCTLMTADMIGVVAPKSGARSIADLKGKMIAAPQQSGVYRMTRALIKDISGVDIEQSSEIQNADNPAQGVTLVIADRADAAVAWEPMISSGIQKRKDLDVIYNAGGAFREKTGLDLPYFCVNVRKELVARSPDTTKRLNDAFAECVSRIDADFANVAGKYAERTKINAEMLQAAKDAGRLRLSHASASSPTTQKTIMTASEMLTRQGMLAKPAAAGFFAI